MMAFLLAGSAAAVGAQETAATEEPRPKSLLTFGDLLVRGDRQSRGRAPDVERARLSVRAGLLWLAGESLEVGAAVRASAGSNDDFVGTDNEERDGVRLDQAFLRWFASDRSTITVGKAPMELWLTPMVWDQDLRPIGLAYGFEREMRAFDTLRLVGALYRGDHRFEDESRIGALQATWSIREGAARGGEIALAYLRFDDLDRLTAAGLGRSNRQVGSRLASDFDLVDLQVAGRVPWAGGALEARLDLVHNLGANAEDDGTRVSLAWTDRPIEIRYEAGVAAQRIQADAVAAAFNSDDWWFHSAVRGASVWLGYHPGRHTTIRLAGFSERQDGREDRFERVLLDVELRW